ncbi:hypothetical protein SNE40_017306 [Patella caerulea]|uniref:Fibrinogen C-terminal domain-containing protein n=1 Tax=Patella caerulea TaxID=87958 RepID=A0AAN8PPU9_PATCE
MRHYKIYPFSFNRTWDEYVNGFMEHSYRIWIGLETLHQISKYSPHQVLTIEGYVETGPRSANTFRAMYTDFNVGNRSTHYTITYSSYKNPNEYSLGNILNGLNGSSFSTFDRDNDGDDTRNCALQYAGGWWFNGLNNCSTNSITSFFTCPSQNCGPNALKKLPGYEHDKILGVELYMG